VAGETRALAAADVLVHLRLGIGLALFVCLNILPDPESFYRTTVLVRVDATGWVLAWHIEHRGIIPRSAHPACKETARYGVLFRALPVSKCFWPSLPPGSAGRANRGPAK
jgi:hypothetical protein